MTIIGLRDWTVPAVVYYAIIITLVVVLLYITIGGGSLGMIKEKMMPSYCTAEYMKIRNMIPENSSSGADECKEQYTDTTKDVYSFTDPTHRIKDGANDFATLNALKHKSLDPYILESQSDDTLNQLLSSDKQQFQQVRKNILIENPGFDGYWSEADPKKEKISESFCVNPSDVRGDSSNCKMSIEKLENQNVRTIEHYTNRIKEGVNFNTYKPLSNHAGVTNDDLLPRNYGVLHHQYLDRFKYAAPLADMDPQYDVPYDYKKESFNSAKKNNYVDFLQETLIDNKIKNNHKEFIQHLKEKNINGNKAKEYSVMSGDSSICSSALARDCYNNIGVCGGASYGAGLLSGEAYMKHKKYCQDYCKPVEHCSDYP